MIYDLQPRSVGKVILTRVGDESHFCLVSYKLGLRLYLSEAGW